MTNHFSLVMLGDSGVNLGIPVDFRGLLHAYTPAPDGGKSRRWDIRVEDGRANVTEWFDAQ